MDLRTKKNHMVISVDTAKNLPQNPSWISNKNPKEHRARGDTYQYNKSYKWETHSQHHPKEENLKQSPWSQERDLSNIILEALAGAIRQEKEIKEVGFLFKRKLRERKWCVGSMKGTRETKSCFLKFQAFSDQRRMTCLRVIAKVCLLRIYHGVENSFTVQWE